MYACTCMHTCMHAHACTHTHWHAHMHIHSLTIYPNTGKPPPGPWTYLCQASPPIAPQSVSFVFGMSNAACLMNGPRVFCNPSPSCRVSGPVTVTRNGMVQPVSDDPYPSCKLGNLSPYVFENLFWQGVGAIPDTEKTPGGVWQGMHPTTSHGERSALQALVFLQRNAWKKLMETKSLIVRFWLNCLDDILLWNWFR